MAPGASLTLILSLVAVADPAAGDPVAARPEGVPALASLETEQAGLFARVAPSVVLLVGGGASGSGFVVSRDGLVLTNAHVVGEENEVSVQLHDGRHGRGRVVARATGALDLALVRIPFSDVPPLAAGAPAAARAGMFAATVGHGGGAAWTFSTGLIANPRPVGDGAPLLLAQMALRPGSSGGPLVDRLGRVVAVVTAGTRDASGVTFAIRVDAAAAAFPQLAPWGAPPAPAPDPTPEPAQTPDEAALIATPEAPGRVLEYARLSASTSPRAAVEPGARMITVWERPRVRRTAGRLPGGSAAPLHHHEAAKVGGAVTPQEPPGHTAPLAAAALAAAGFAGWLAARRRARGQGGSPA
jgi:S1-C subfamily serine protease